MTVDRMLASLCLLIFGFLCIPLAAQDDATQAEADAPVAVAVGEEAPNFELETFDDKTIKLSDRFDQSKPVVLLFSRANW